MAPPGIEPLGVAQLMKVYVTANRISNMSLEVQVKPNSTVADLKYQIEAQWKVPACCQNLLIGLTVLRDFDKLSTHRKPGATGLSVTMIIILDFVLQDLASIDDHRRQSALAALAQLGKAGGENALAAVGACFEDRKADVRYAAVRALPLVADVGNPAAISAVCQRLEDKDIGVRNAAAEVLVQVTDKGNEIAVTFLCRQLEHRDGGVRNAAVELLGKVTDKGDEVAMWEVGLRLESKAAGVRRAALRALAQVSPDGHEGAIAAIRMFIEDPDAGVRKAATAALVQVGMPLYPALDPDCQEAYEMLMEMRDEYEVKMALLAPDDAALEVSNMDGKPLLSSNLQVATCPNGHALIPLGTSCDDGWLCDGSRHPAGCRSGIDNFYQTSGMQRYRCAVCDFDLCQRCAETKAEVYGGDHARSMKALNSALMMWRCHPVIMGKNGEPLWRPELSNGDELDIKDPALDADGSADAALTLTNGDEQLEDSDEEMPALLDPASGSVVMEHKSREEDEENDEDMPVLVEVSRSAGEDEENDEDMPGLVEVPRSAGEDEEESDDDLPDLVEFDDLVAPGESGAADEPGRIARAAAAVEDLREREAALEALAMEAEKGDPAAIATVSKGLRDTNERVRRMALEVLSEVADPGDAAAIEAVSQILKSPNAFIRRDAVTALAMVAEQGDENCISLVEACLQDSHSSVRTAAFEAMAVLADKSEMRALGLVVDTPESAGDDAKRLTVKGISMPRAMLPSGDDDDAMRPQVQATDNDGSRLITAMSQRLEREMNTRSRHAVQDAMAEVVVKADSEYSEKTPDEEIQCAIIGAAALLAVTELIK